jgi:hypothetical protein
LDSSTDAVFLETLGAPFFAGDLGVVATAGFFRIAAGIS